MTLAIVTASLDLARAAACLDSWGRAWPIYVVLQGTQRVEAYQGAHPPVVLLPQPEILGVVPAFALGVQAALNDGAEIIACLHDDLLIEAPLWDMAVRRLFQDRPAMGLCGFGGATGLGDADLYQKPYAPMQLARQGFRSNMRDAEAHGIRAEKAERVVCLDGFSQIGRREFWEGFAYPPPSPEGQVPASCGNLFGHLQQLGITHHLYDSLLGCYAKRLNWEVWMLPIRVHHFGGRTAVGDARYAEWALQQTPGGDAGFWQQAHATGYAAFRDVLPLRLP